MIKIYKELCLTKQTWKPFIEFVAFSIPFLSTFKKIIYSAQRDRLHILAGNLVSNLASISNIWSVPVNITACTN